MLPRASRRLIETHEEHAAGHEVTGALYDGGGYVEREPDEAMDDFKIRLFGKGGGVAFAMYHGESQTEWQKLGVSHHRM